MKESEINGRHARVYPQLQPVQLFKGIEIMLATHVIRFDETEW